jgi:hypothetical protein
MSLFKVLYVYTRPTTAEHWTRLYPHVQRQAWQWDRLVRLSLLVVDSIAMQLRFESTAIPFSNYLNSHVR